MENGRWINKFRVLTMALIFSGALNVGLLAALVFSALDDSKISVTAKSWPGAEALQIANQQLLSQLLPLSFPQLVTYLTNKEPVEEGYAKRDLALSALTFAHHFNLDRALSFSPIQRRQVPLNSDQTVEFYPGLSEEQYEAIIRFAYQEKWPLTSKGLFLLLAQNKSDASLSEAFFVTPEFHALQVLFQKTGSPQENGPLLALLCEGPWELAEAFAKTQAQTLDFSVEKRRALLLSYLAHRSPAAAGLLIRTDYAFAKTRIEDAGIVALLGLLREKTAESERFCQDLLHSPRSDAVLQAAGERLRAYGGEVLLVPLEIPTPRAAPKREHIVQAGESLWKISRHYNVKVEDLVQANAIESERLFPGMTLRIPD